MTPTNFRKRHCNTDGFSLIELMIAVAVLAIIASIAIPMYRDYTTTSKQNAARSIMEQFTILIESYRAENGTMCPLCSTTANGAVTYSYTEDTSGSENTTGNKISTAFPDFKPKGATTNASLYHYQVTFTTAGCPGACSQSAKVTAIPQAAKGAPPGNIVSGDIR